MFYESVALRQEISIERIYTIHYFEYRNDFRFPGERHNFWELCFVDKGEVRVTTEDSSVILKKGEVIFHKPNEFHSLAATGSSAPNLAVISFPCEDEAMRFFEGKRLRADDTERNLLARIILEAQKGFYLQQNNPYQEKMIKKEAAPFGTEQFIRLYLEQLLLHIRRRCTIAEPYQRIQKTSKATGDTEQFRHIVRYMEQHIRTRLTVEQICRENTIGRSQLQKLFRTQSGRSVMDYFTNLKMESAKERIRTSDMNFTQIAEELGFTSIHYFSRQFKKVTGMTPTEYAYSLKALTERLPE